MRYIRFAILLLPLSLYSQQSDKYLFPIRPGEQNFLAGTMGELRSGHFHGGLDIKTGGQEGQPVYATMDGYVSRISITSGGYGHALYLTHPDGNTSVYGHLQKFEKKLEDYLREKQYEKESYEIRLFPEKGEFVYKKGDIIAYSGNTGSSSGPHLHFEIRDPNQRFLNPMEFGFTEVKDNLPPILKRVAFVALDENARINGSFGRFEFGVIKTNGIYTTTKPIQLSGNVGVQVYHYDNMNGTWSRNGIPEFTFLVDGDTVFRQVKERMRFNLNRNILVHFDYQKYQTSRRKFNKLYVSDGNELDIYTHQTNLHFDKERSYEFRMVFRDAHNNFSVFESKVNNRRIVYEAEPTFKEFLIRDNHMHIVSSDTVLGVHYGYQQTMLRPYRTAKGKTWYIWDLRNGLPDSIRSNHCNYYPDFYTTIPSGFEYEFFNRHFDIKTGKKTLFDTVYLRFEKSFDTLNNRELFKFKNLMDPLRTNATITLKPDQRYGDKHAVYSVFGNRLNYVGGLFAEDGSIRFSTRDLVTFTVAEDTIPPSITPLSWNRGYLRMKITDDLSGIGSYRATLDGQFLLMSYDAKKNTLHARPRNPNISLKGEFILRVEDNMGNETEIKRIL